MVRMEWKRTTIPLCEIQSKGGACDAFQNQCCPLISESKFSCNSNVRWVTPGPMSIYVRTLFPGHEAKVHLTMSISIRFSGEKSLLFNVVGGKFFLFKEIFLFDFERKNWVSEGSHYCSLTLSILLTQKGLKCLHKSGLPDLLLPTQRKVISPNLKGSQ